jgi:pilus assembly protein CpaE
MAKALILCPDLGMKAELLALVNRYSVKEVETYPAGRELAELLSSGPPEICFVDVVSDRGEALGLLAQIADTARGVRTVSLLGSADSDLILASLRHGADEFLVRPFTAEQLQAVMAKLEKLRPAAAEQPNCGTVYCIMPGKGASGATTIACNLACQFKRSGTGKVLLADMDPLTGTVAFVLKLRSHFSFIDALRHAADLDADLWRSLVTASPAGDVMLSPENPVDGITEARDASPIVEYARRQYQNVVLDAGGPYGEWSLALARLCDKLLLVSTNELPALHATQRALAGLEANGIPRAKIGLLLNRYHPDAGLTREAIESVMPLEILAAVPSDYHAMQRALLDGKPAHPGSAFGKCVADLEARLEGRTPPPHKPTPAEWLASLFKGIRD